MKSTDSYQIISFENLQNWESWLQEHHLDTKGIWLKIAKNGSRILTVSYQEALECALCYGWIDSQKGALDEQFWLQKFTRRGPKSGWSKINCEKVEALIIAGKMKASGMLQVEQAKADGRWASAYESQSRMSVPDDFQNELDKNQKAQEFFKTLNSVNRYAFLYRIQTAKRPETRIARIQKFIEMLERSEKIHP